MWIETENQINVVLLRHGKTKGNLEHRYIGSTDEVLCEQGIEEVLRLKHREILPKIDRLFISPKKRCRMTAKLLFPDAEQQEVDGFSEIQFGEFEGKNYEELKDVKAYQDWLDSGGMLSFPNGENRTVYRKRVVRAFQDILEDVLKEKETEHKKTIGIVAHGGTIMALMSQYAGGDYFDYQVKNGSGYEFSVCGTPSHFSFQNIQKIE